MKYTDNNLREHLDADVTAMCTCWIITRTDGVVVRFTDADLDIEVDREMYTSIGAYQRTAIESTSTLSVDNLDVIGITGDLVLSVESLRSGVYDNAEVKIFMTSWMYYVSTKLKLRRGFFGQVQVMPNGTFKVELRGVLQRLAHTYTNIFSPSCLHDLGDSKCKIPINPDEVTRSTAYAVGDIVKAIQGTATTGDQYILSVGDSSFETAGSNGVDKSLYWRNSGANDLAATSLVSRSGTYSMGGGAGAGTLIQDIDLLSEGVSVVNVDAGNCYLTTGAWRYDVSSTGRFSVTYLAEDMSVISTGYDTGYTDTSGIWVLYSQSNNAIPTLTRFIRIQFDVTATASYIDEVFGYIIDTTSGLGTPESYGNVMWRCTTAGTTDAGAVAYTGGAATIVVDGTATFTAEESWTRSGLVTASAGTREFNALITDPEGVDGWFNGGLITFHSGDNAGASMEVKDWIQTNGEIELFLSLPHTIEPGSTFTIYPGCDKSRVGCSVIFDNIINILATPDVPGEDELFRYPDAK